MDFDEERSHCHRSCDEKYENDRDKFNDDRVHVANLPQAEVNARGAELRDLMANERVHRQEAQARRVRGEEQVREQMLIFNAARERMGNALNQAALNERNAPQMAPNEINAMAVANAAYERIQEIHGQMAQEAQANANIEIALLEMQDANPEAALAEQEEEVAARQAAVERARQEEAEALRLLAEAEAQAIRGGRTRKSRTRKSRN